MHKCAARGCTKRTFRTFCRVHEALIATGEKVYLDDSFTAPIRAVTHPCMAGSGCRKGAEWEILLRGDTTVFRFCTRDADSFEELAKAKGYHVELRRAMFQEGTTVDTAMARADADSQRAEAILEEQGVDPDLPPV